MRERACSSHAPRSRMRTCGRPLTWQGRTDCQSRQCAAPRFHTLACKPWSRLIALKFAWIHVHVCRAVHELGATPEALRRYETVRQPLNAPVHATSVELFRDFVQASGAAGMRRGDGWQLVGGVAYFAAASRWSYVTAVCLSAVTGVSGRIATSVCAPSTSTSVFSIKKRQYVCARLLPAAGQGQAGVGAAGQH